MPNSDLNTRPLLKRFVSEIALYQRKAGQYIHAPFQKSPGKSSFGPTWKVFTLGPHIGLSGPSKYHVEDGVPKVVPRKGGARR